MSAAYHVRTPGKLPKWPPPPKEAPQKDPILLPPKADVKFSEAEKPEIQHVGNRDKVQKFLKKPEQPQEREFNKKSESKWQVNSNNKDTGIQINRSTTVDPCFVGAGRAPGLEIWRIQKFGVTPVSPAEYGKFHSGDSYIVLYTRPKPGNKSGFDRSIHFWLGKDSSQDEWGTAAYKTVELDDYLGGSPVQYREVQAHETPQFLSLFPNGIQYLEGGVASGFRKVEKDKYEVRLLHLKGKQYVRVSTVPVAHSSLNEGDVFILDAGLKIYQWDGPKASRRERIKGLDVAIKIKDDERKGRAVFHLVDGKDKNVEQEFWKHFGGKPTKLKSAQEGGDDIQHEQATNYSLHKISNASGKLSVTPVGKYPLSREMLNSDDCFVLDTGSDNQLFVWVGRGANLDERKEAMNYANQYLAQNNRPSWVPIVRVAEGGEPPMFKSKFANWPETVIAKATPSSRVAKVDPNREIDYKGLHQKQATTKDDFPEIETGNVEVYRMENFKPVPVEKAHFGRFHSGDSYLVIHRFPFKGKEQAVTYFWQGRHSSQDEKGSSAILAKEFSGKFQNAPQVRVVQGKEPDHFLRLFKGQMVVHDGGHSPAFRNVSENASKFDDDSVALFHIRGTNELNTRGVQVPAKASSLNSSDAFLLRTPEKVFLWHGQYSNEFEKKYSETISKLFTGLNKRGVQKVNEGEEPPEFWKALGGKAPYPTDGQLYPPNRDPRLFRCSNAKGYLDLEEVPNYSQDDLDPNDVFLLDTYNDMYAWVGDKANDVEKKGALESAQKYLAAAEDGRNADTPVMKVEAGKEPAHFTQHFLGWDPIKAAEKEDPYEAKLRQALGGMKTKPNENDYRKPSEAANERMQSFPSDESQDQSAGNPNRGNASRVTSSYGMRPLDNDTDEISPRHSTLAREHSDLDKFDDLLDTLGSPQSRNTDNRSSNEKMRNPHNSNQRLNMDPLDNTYGVTPASDSLTDAGNVSGRPGATKNASNRAPSTTPYSQDSDLSKLDDLIDNLGNSPETSTRGASNAPPPGKGLMDAQSRQAGKSNDPSKDSRSLQSRDAADNSNEKMNPGRNTSHGNFRATDPNNKGNIGSGANTNASKSDPKSTAPSKFGTNDSQRSAQSTGSPSNNRNNVNSPGAGLMDSQNRGRSASNRDATENAPDSDDHTIAIPPGLEGSIQKSSDKVVKHHRNPGEILPCSQCNQNIEEEYCVEALDRIWHIHHFRCHRCNTNLSDFYAFPDRQFPYCKPCYYKELICSSCNRSLVDLFIQADDGKKYHVDCYYPYSCSRCSQQIRGVYVEALDKQYHEKCFTCTSCNKLIGDQFKEYRNDPYCMTCDPAKLTSTSFRTTSSDQSTVHSGSTICTECKKPIVGSESINIKNQSWHDTCFKCSQCHKLLVTNRTSNTIPCRQKSDGSIICLDCANQAEKSVSITCSSCGLPIKGKYAEVKGRQFHVDCFKCASCQNPLKDNFFQTDNGFVCENCTVKCTTCKRTIAGECVEIASLGKKYHPQCFTCHYCGNVLSDEFFNANGNVACESCASNQ